MGQWKKGRAHGTANFIQFLKNDSDQAKGNTYEGLWQYGRKHGYGKETWPDDARFEGNYQNDKKHGKGVLFLADGSKFQGEFKEGVIEGNGCYEWKCGKKYNG